MRHYKPKPDGPFKRFNSSAEIIRLVVLMYVRFALSLRNVEDLLSERGIDISYETVRFWWNRFGPLFAADVRRQRCSRMRGFRHWRWHLDEVYVKINGETIIFGVQSITKVRCSRAWSPRRGTRRPHSPGAVKANAPAGQLLLIGQGDAAFPSPR